MVSKPIVIAEIAQGFEGNFELAKLLITASAKAKASIVKFQLVYADDLATPDYEHYKLFKTLEFTKQQWKDLVDFSRSLAIDICFDVFGKSSIDVVKNLGIKLIKIHPTDINNFSLLNEFNRAEYSIFLGIGGAGLTEIENALLSLKKARKVILVLGYQAYPTPNEYNHISRISYLKEQLISFSNLDFGFADHVVDKAWYSTVLNAMAFVGGANYFEKHLSFGKCVELEDHESALQPDEFKDFVEGLEMAVEAFGKVKTTEYFGMSLEEETYRNNIRRSWVATRNLAKGHLLMKEDIVFKRSGDKVESTLTDVQLIGSKLNRHVIVHQKFMEDDIS